MTSYNLVLDKKFALSAGADYARMFNKKFNRLNKLKRSISSKNNYEKQCALEFMRGVIREQSKL